MSDHTEWDLKKIREECLKLMGVTQTVIGRDNGVEFVKLEAPEGVNASGNPTTSLDDALPLMEKLNVALGPRKDPDTGSVTWSTQCRHPLYEMESPYLAVCLSALACAGRDLDDFKVKP